MNFSSQKNISAQIIDKELNGADTTWILFSTCLVFIMIPGVGYFYGGITSKKNLLTMLMAPGLSIAVNSIQWFIWGFSLSFAETSSKFIGNLDNLLLMNVNEVPHPLAPTIPKNCFMIFQGMFACISPALAFGSAAERTPILTFVVFSILWSTFVYDFIAYWTWSENGWLHQYGCLDFAVHITSGFSALAYSLTVGPRRTVDFKKLKPSNPSDVYLGTTLLWFGWLGFNAGSELSINSRAVNAVLVSNLSASAGAITWVIAEMIKKKSRRMSLNGFCCGAVAGLVAITPASGFVKPHFAIVFGVLGAIVCFFSLEIINLTKSKYDDACDVFGGIFADNSVVTMSGDMAIKGGWMNRHYMQLAYQLLSVAVTACWSFFITLIILNLIGCIPFLRLKLTEQEEKL